jgi:hypothetical protein
VPTYLVERYWPGVTSELLLEALNRCRQVIEEMSGEGIRVRGISWILIPREEVVFSVYEGPSTDAVRQLNERADIPISRIVEAIVVNGRLDRLVPVPHRVCKPTQLCNAMQRAEGPVRIPKICRQHESTASQYMAGQRR